MKKVSVILPTYNDFKYLKYAVDSILTQTYENYEVIIVNDGSTDATKGYLDDLSDSRLNIIHQENSGASGAINSGIEICSGELVTWVSSDNISGPYLLEALVAALENNSAAKFAYSAYYNIDKDGNILSINSANYQLTNELLSGSIRGNVAFMYYKNCHDEVGKYIDSPSTDTDFWAKLTAKYQSVYIVEPLCFYRFHDNRATSSLPQGYIQQALTTIWDSFEQMAGNEDVLSMIYLITTIAKPSYTVYNNSISI